MRALAHTIKSIMRFIGQLWGHTFLHYVVLAYMRWRVSKFEIHAEGIEHLLAVKGKSYVLVSNHVPPLDLILKVLAFKPMRRFNHAIDSFVFQQVVHEQTGHWVRVVAKYGRDSWYGSRPLRAIQRYVRQPLTQGQMEGVGYVPVDLKAGAVQRDFLETVGNIIRRGGSLLIFPEGNVFSEFEADRSLRGGAAHLARKYKIPILPAYIVGCHTWRPGTRVDLRFGPPIPTDGLSKEQIIEEIKRGIVALRQETPPTEQSSPVS
jgi:1-acyl-sn-glycerol-3-phosphate acyltransferase